MEERFCVDGLLNDEKARKWWLIAVFAIITFALFSSCLVFAGSKTYTADADFLGFSSWDLQDEDWSDITDWTSISAGTATVEESPSSQLHLNAGDSSGTDSDAGKYQVFVTDQAEFTIELRIKFDQIANYGTQIKDGVQITAFNGMNQYILVIFADQIRYYSTDWNVFCSDSISTGVWYTYRIVCDSPGSGGGDLAVYRGGTLIGSKTDARVWSSDNGRVDIQVHNWSASPEETECHVDYLKVATGLHPPLSGQKGNFLDTDIHAAADEIQLCYDNEDTPARHESGTWTINYDAGESVQWDSLSWNATLNGSSNVKFRVRSASSESGLSGASWYPSGSEPSSWDLLDEDWEDYSDWTFTFNGVYAYEESPSGQLHLTCGNSGGTDSNVSPYRYVTGSVSALTIEVRVKFDQLASYNADHHGLIIAHQNGTYKFRIQIFADKIRYRASGGWADMLNDSVSTGVWYTYRVLLDTTSHSINVYRDGAYLGQGTDPYSDSGLNGHTEVSVINWPTSPAETEVHVEYTRVATGTYVPTRVEGSPYDMTAPENRWLQIEATLERQQSSTGVTSELEDVTINWTTTGSTEVRRPPGVGVGGFLMF